ncbi:MmgE/PrpD family protein [Jiangella asiatica]|uniref:MmgE/PrpD N-terminal domain-containing protein n=1 Tax=Jiangella asiatica TaxID=2530372 RepID=A0A4R5CQH6_9ACTN|nr:MmgE/PrpD family protein [Jiangella asiatica]TDE00664.1 hypothetical protein E1269_24700 [Jiangella asiatica]
MKPTTPETKLSRFVAELDWDDLPPRVQDRVVEIWADAVANALAGRSAANTAAVEGLATALCGPGDSTVVGGGTLAPTGAALLNGYQITAFTMCDVYRPALCHVTPEVVPAVLAVAEAGDVSGRDLLTAIAAGLEVTTRLGLGVDYPVFRARGWHAPGVIGTIGAAMAAARALGLDAAGVCAAMGLGGSQAAGTFAALGTPAVKFHQARGAVSGLWAARFAAGGLGGAENILTHTDGGLLTTYAGGGRPGHITRQLGERWELEQISLRRWAAASSLQSLVAALLSVPADDLRPSDLVGVDVALPPTSYAMCGDMGWDDELSAMQSARYVTTVVLHDRQCWIEQFTADRRSDVPLAQFARARVSVDVGAGLPPSGVGLRITRRSGSPLVVHRDGAPGEPAEPLTRETIREKLAAVGGGSLDEVVFGVAGRSAAEVAAALRATPSSATAGRS